MASVLLTLLARLRASTLKTLGVTGRQQETVTYTIILGHIILVSITHPEAEVWLWSE
jgi:hypothetical protein